MAGPARTITPIPRRHSTASTARTLSDLNGAGQRRDLERDMILAKALDGKLNNTGTLTLATGGATTTVIEDPRISGTTFAVLIPLDQNAAASMTTISQEVTDVGEITLTHAASGLTRAFGFVLFGLVFWLAGGA